MTSIKTIVVAALVAASAGTAFASDNRIGTATGDSIRQRSQTMSNFVAEGRNTHIPGEFGNGNASKVVPMAPSGTGIAGGKESIPSSISNGLEYRGAAN
jgi:hypothetical protein